MGFDAQKTSYEIQVCCREGGTVREISSCSLCGVDFRPDAERHRTKGADAKSTRLVTRMSMVQELGGRALIAPSCSKNNQKPDGSVAVTGRFAAPYGRPHSDRSRYA